MIKYRLHRIGPDTRRMKAGDFYTVAGWEIEKRPNSFAERWNWVAYALNKEGFVVKEVGFLRKGDATAYCKTYPHKIED